MKKKVVVLTGAGISAESGLSTFRDSDGMWENYRVEDVCTPEALQKNPEVVLNFYNMLRHQMVKASPNEGHRQLVRLEEYYDVRIITQNIDNLHERAGSTNVLHLHGELTKGCSVDDLTLEVDLGNRDIQLGDKAPDGKQLRPFIVFFSEPVPNFEPASDLCEEADYFVVIGTSMVVYPAAGLIHYVPRDASCYLVDPKSVTVSRPIKSFQECAGTGVKKVVDELIALAQQE